MELSPKEALGELKRIRRILSIFENAEGVLGAVVRAGIGRAEALISTYSRSCLD